MLENILAKKDPDELLTTHLNNAVKIWGSLKEELNDIQFLDEEFWKNSLLTILFHDAGKITKNFQKLHYTDKNYLRHEFISGIMLIVTNISYFEENSLPVWAIFSHHKPLNDNLFTNDIHKEIEITKKDLDDFFIFVKQTYEKYFNGDFISTLKINNFHTYKNTDSFYEYLKSKFTQTFREISANDRKKYIFYKAILNEADWVASAKDNIFDKLEYDVIGLKVKIIKNLIKQRKIQNIDDFKFRDFQLESKISFNVIARAPTGSGKTEASLIWASLKEKHSRIFYLLPTKVTSNAIYTRLKSYFGENNTAIVHSSAFLLQKEEHNNDYSYFNYLKDKTFFKMVNVCTIDQILTQGFNLGYWELKTFHQLRSKIIIDEIHLYDAYTLGLIISTIKYLKDEFSATFYLMSATMPTKLKYLLLKTLGKERTRFIDDNELLKAQRNQFNITDKNINELLPDIIKNVQKGKKVLCVINTVDNAIKTYDELKAKLSDYKVMCYHSRFIVKDRLEKEKRILEWENSNDGCLLVATQVVEVSLDINYDVLFTENAPIDAIIQRAGRVNRRYTKNNTQVIIFPHTEVSSKYVYSEDILQNTFKLLSKKNGKRLTEQELIQLVDEVYVSYDIENNHDYIEGKNIFLKIQRNNHYIKDVSTDESIFTRKGLDSIDVIPIKFYEQLIDANRQQKSKFLVTVRKNKLFQFRKVKDKNDKEIIYLDVKYSFEKGLEFKTNDSTVESI